MTKETILIGSDPSGFTLKEAVKAHLVERGFEVADVGTQSLEEPVMYYDVGERFGRAISEGTYQRGIVICGTGVGISLAANKVKGIRCVVCSEPYSAQMSRLHNNANMLAFGARVIGPELAKMIARVWLETPFEGGRHQRRVDLITQIEKGDILD